MFSGDVPLGGDRYQVLVQCREHVPHPQAFPQLDLGTEQRNATMNGNELGSEIHLGLNHGSCLLLLSCDLLNRHTYAELLPVCGVEAT